MCYPGRHADSDAGDSPRPYPRLGPCSEIAVETAKTYLPELPVGTTSGCCSDQQAFYEQVGEKSTVCGGEGLLRAWGLQHHDAELPGRPRCPGRDPCRNLDLDTPPRR